MLLIGGPAFAPLFGVALDRLQAGALWVTAGIGPAAFAALLALREHAPVRTPAILSPGATR